MIGSIYLIETKSKGKPEEKSQTKDTQKPKKQKRQKRDTTSSSGFAGDYIPDSRMTIEVLDDASPDATPRLDEDDENDRKIALEKNKLASKALAEKKFRKLQFEDEKGRVVKGADTFVRSGNVTVADIESERRRLIKLEESARNRAKREQTEVRGQKQYLQQDRSALKLQAAFRGHIGRQKFSLTKSLQNMDSNEEFGDWIQVVDPENGDSWYYNKTTGKSQFEKPKSMSDNSSDTGSGVNKLPSLTKTNNVGSSSALSNTSSPARTKNGKRTLEVSMSLPSLDAMGLAKSANQQQQQLDGSKGGGGGGTLKKQLSFQSIDSAAESDDASAQKEVNNILGIDKFSSAANLTAPDGTFKPQLRTVVLDALLDSRFDSVSTVLADSRWYEEDKDLFKEKKKKAVKGGDGNQFGVETKEDLNRTPFVSTLTINKKKAKRGLALEASDTGKRPSTAEALEPINETKDLTFKQVEHIGFENGNSNEIMCFGCWSSGLQRRCELHDAGQMLKPSQTMLLCRNWDLDVMRRRYRSEEIQELFLQRESSLRFDAKHKRFTTVTEQRHPVYRARSQVNSKFNARMVLFERIKRWMLSMTEELRMGSNMPSHADDISKMLRLKRNLIHHSRTSRFTRANLSLLPVAPTTGYSWPERTGDIQYLYKHMDPSLTQEVDLIISLPVPQHKHLYKPRQYHLSLSKSIPMPEPSYNQDPESRVLPTNTHIPDDHDAAWLEKISAAVARDCVHAAKSQVKAFTPVSQIEMLVRTKKPPPSTIKSASIGRKPCPENMAVGGLALDFLVYQLICTFIPTQYGNFLVMDKASVSPGVSAEVNISFNSVVMGPIVQHHIIRPLEHPLNYRRTPTVTLNSNVTPDQRHFYGINRPEQTGEQEYHGFRTTAWAPMLLTYLETDPLVFVPGQGVVSLNTPKANISYTTHADCTYPFCEPSTRDNSTLDFYHLLLTGVVSPNKPQVFTALTVQEAGQFMKGYNQDAPMGHLVVSVYRSWAFTQRDTIQEFRTDDGVPYWYHRKTGQTFWERPLYEDEEASPLVGGTILDVEHPEEPLMMTKGEEGAERRYLQGEFRQQMLMHIETKKDAVDRRRAAAVTVKSARERGIIPEIPGFASILNHASSSELVSRFDITGPNNSSLMANTQMSSGMPGGNMPSSPTSPQYGNRLDGPPMSPMEDGAGDGYGYAPPPGQEEFAPRVNGIAVQRGASAGFVRGSMLDEGSLRPNAQPNSGGFGGGGGGGNTYQNGNAMGMGMGAGLSNFSPGSPSYQGQGSETMQSSQQQMLPAAGMMMPGAASPFPGLDTGMINNLSNMIGQMMSNMMMMDHNNPQTMVQLGLGMGMALMSSGAVQNVVSNQITNDNQQLHQQQQQEPSYLQGMRGSTVISHSQASNEEREFGVFPTIGEDEASAISHEDSLNSPRSQVSRVSIANPVSMMQNKNEPIGKAYPTAVYSADKVLDHNEEQNQRVAVAERIKQPLNTMEMARNLKVDKATETPDVAPPKILTNCKPSNAEEGLRLEKSQPLIAYPELSTMLPDGAPVPFSMQQPAGMGTSFVSKAEEHTQKMVAGADHLRRTVMPLPVGFFAAIEAKHVAQQAVDYLPQVPNLPQARNIGRVKPRSAAADWMMISFDPWSAGKNPLGTEFISSLMEKAEKFVEGGPAKAAGTFEQLRQSTLAGAFVSVEDEAGLAQQRADITKAEHLAEDFKKVCSLCRHSKFSDAEQLINQPDWSVPIDYQDDQGNTLLHIVAQNGNKRMVKLCMRRGASLDLQNLTGQTALHFAYGYGYADVGDYLKSKGANDAITNKDGLTCYEGLGAKELEFL